MTLYDLYLVAVYTIACGRTRTRVPKFLGRVGKLPLLRAVPQCLASWLLRELPHTGILCSDALAPRANCMVKDPHRIHLEG